MNVNDLLKQFDANMRTRKPQFVCFAHELLEDTIDYVYNRDAMTPTEDANPEVNHSTFQKILNSFQHHPSIRVTKDSDLKNANETLCRLFPGQNWDYDYSAYVGYIRPLRDTAIDILSQIRKTAVATATAVAADTLTADPSLLIAQAPSSRDATSLLFSGAATASSSSTSSTAPASSSSTSSATASSSSTTTTSRVDLRREQKHGQ